MKHSLIISILLVLTSLFQLRAADAPEKPWKYVDSESLRIINKGFNDSERTYSRFPKWLKDSVREALWQRQEESAGMGIRFATNSSRIGARYHLLRNGHMLHMADTGLKGSDLYILEGDSVWRHVNTNRPAVNNPEEKKCETTYVSNLDTTAMREYMIYLPLYDGVLDFEVKVDSTATITKGNPEVISPKGRILCYGTSIMQGGCASRTGMASSNILSRRLNREVINLGFSGQGKMDFPVARAIAQVPDLELIILDPVPNCTEMMCDTLTYDFVKIIREARPDVPILMVEGPIYPYARYDSYFGDYLPKKNKAYRRNYERLKAENPDNLYYIDSINLDGPEDDGTVDGIHLTDLGFVHYADKLYPVIVEILNSKNK
jgi:hypothetical protein